mmetsp:Transcript_1109/g.1146  ORF Transcript_1109/g.1146 Transcript_1109/m.1146 type:complete len:200 (-) Transcript_1109:116-715(-)
MLPSLGWFSGIARVGRQRQRATNYDLFRQYIPSPLITLNAFSWRFLADQFGFVEWQPVEFFRSCKWHVPCRDHIVNRQGFCVCSCGTTTRLQLLFQLKPCQHRCANGCRIGHVAPIPIGVTGTGKRMVFRWRKERFVSPSRDCDSIVFGIQRSNRGISRNSTSNSSRLVAVDSSISRDCSETDVRALVQLLYLRSDDVQ